MKKTFCCKVGCGKYLKSKEYFICIKCKRTFCVNHIIFNDKDKRNTSNVCCEKCFTIDNPELSIDFTKDTLAAKNIDRSLATNFEFE